MESTEKGLELLDQKIEYLAKLKELTQKEKDLIESQAGDDILDIGKILEEKNNLMNKIDEVDDKYRYLIPRKDNRIRQKESHIKNMLLELIEIDREKNDIMDKRFKSVKGGLKGVRQSIKANKAYNYEEQNNIFIDQKK